MTVAAPPEVAEDVSLLPLRWTREAYHRLGESGVLGEDTRWELIEGQIYRKMSQGNAHIAAGRAVAAALRAIFGEGYDVSSAWKSENLPASTTQSSNRKRGAGSTIRKCRW